MSSSRKKVILRTTADATLSGYLPLAGLIENDSVSLLDLSGRVIAIPLASVKTICYVRDFNLTDTLNPERLTRRTFLARPRTEGLWLRITFASGDQLEGLAPLDLSLLDALIHDRGLYLIPPDIRSNTQRLFVPHAAMTGLQLLGVITSPSKAAPAPKPTRPDQNDLFPPND
ncbi:hypothetical protein FTO74_07950 [Granulicella sp. WH15]|uniref:DUF6982 domain-containing protein n=1 Tax=Granulicella sp. WH15 TaxID=2602070 RepID=UPI0013674EC7|nr:hypothetical protein [Granulicella sp. WH15]QHN03303.1 hypothetical protein FTO74_07950 [Granulicella sp. WH15]